MERVRRRSPIATKRAAEEYERVLRVELTQPEEEKEEKVVPTFGEFWVDFARHAKTENKPSEFRMKESTFTNHLQPVFGSKRLNEIGQLDIDRYKVTKIESGLSPKTVNNHLTILRRALSVACDWELLDTIPKVKWLRVPDPEFDFLTFEEADRLIDAADDDWRAMIFTGLRTGLRQGELLALQWDDIDLVVGRLIVRRSDWRGHVGIPKSRRSRELPLSEETVAVLKAHRHLKGDLVFCPDTGRPFTENELRWPLYRACKHAGIRRIGWHVLRHSFASHPVMRGVTLKAVQELLGHATMEMTMRYAHLSPDVRRDAVALLDRPSDSKILGPIWAPAEGASRK